MTIGKTFIAAALGLAPLATIASQLELNFSVQIDQKFTSLTSSESFDPTPFLYSILIDTASLSSSGFGNTANTSFQSVLYPETPYTSEVISKVPSQLTNSGSSASIYREYSPIGFGSGVPSEGVPSTFQAIFLNFNSFSAYDQATNSWINYQRGFQRQGAIGSGNQLTTFNAGSFQAYMTSLVGDSSFRFNDQYIESTYYPALNYGMTTDAYGYQGRGTLLSVTAVPEPETYSLMLVGMALIGILARRRKHQI